MNNAKVFLLVQFFDVNGGLISQQTQDYPSAFGNSYASLAASGMTPAGAKRVCVHVGIQSLAAGGSGTFYVDDMFFTLS
ncbi:hypothetical protein LJR153_000612 [Paenibacillus sp. LjRoot153]|uniref:hypothetical protein n=1 Tax=Paenibacillus sp. LjRoot153 TaxID=3342270 RepID=UPI003ECE0475